MSSKNKFDILNEGLVSISREGWDKVGLATYREDYLDELSSLTWSRKGNYLKNSKLEISLHKYIMMKWYGEDEVKEMLDKGWVIDHMDNNGYNCTIENLEFLSRHINTSKGNWLDIEKEDARQHIALGLFKDFSTGNYQITIGFNDDVGLNKDDGKLLLLDNIKLLYNSSYKTVILEAERILNDYRENNEINLDKLSFKDIKIQPAIFINRPIDDKEEAFIKPYEGRYLLSGKGIYIHTIGYEKGWSLNEKE